LRYSNRLRKSSFESKLSKLRYSERLRKSSFDNDVTLAPEFFSPLVDIEELPRRAEFCALLQTGFFSPGEREEDSINAI
jgi:hypothetical protein